MVKASSLGAGGRRFDSQCLQAVGFVLIWPVGEPPATVELWSLELACLEHQRSLELVRRSRQFPYTFNVKIHPRFEQRWLELSNSKHGPQGDFSCKNAMMARTEYKINKSVTRLIKVYYYFHKRSVTMVILPLGYLTDERNVWSN